LKKGKRSKDLEIGSIRRRFSVGERKGRKGGQSESAELDSPQAHIFPRKGGKDRIQ